MKSKNEIKQWLSIQYARATSKSLLCDDVGGKHNVCGVDYLNCIIIK